MKNFKFIICDAVALVLVFLIVCLSPFITAYVILYLAAKENNAVWQDEIKSPMKPNWKIIEWCAVATLLYYGFWFWIVNALKQIV